METFEVGLNAHLHYDMATSLWGPGSGMWWFERKRPPKRVALFAVWPCWSRYGLVGGSGSLWG